MLSYRKVGGIHFFRVGQIGWSAYRTQKHEGTPGELALWALFIGLFAYDVYLVAQILSV